MGFKHEQFFGLFKETLVASVCMKGKANIPMDLSPGDVTLPCC